MAVEDNLTRAEAFERSALVSEVSYEVTLDLTRGDETFGSETAVRFTASAPEPTFVDFDARRVRRVVLNGAELPADAFTGFRIALDGVEEGPNELVVEADCAYQHTGVGLHRFTDPVDGEVYLYTQFEPFDTHRVFACFDQPDLKAAFSLSVQAPAGWVVVGNAREVERPPSGEAGRWRFEPTPPLSTYVTAVVAGPYSVVSDRHGDIDLGLYCRRSLAQHLDHDEIFEITKQGFDYFTEAFAYPYPFGKYDQLFVPEFNAGAMENAGCVTFSESYVYRSKVTEASRRRRAETILHEMAHMWFGDLVTMRWWDDLWLNESFATYLSYLAMVDGTRFTQAWADFTTELKAWAYNQDQLPSTHPVVADMVDTDSVRNNFDGITYAKGASVLRQLGAWVGTDAFLEGLRRYFPRHEYGNAELADFLAVLEDSSGRDLASWADEWLQTAGVATLRPVISTSSDPTEGSYTQVAIEQEATDEHPTLRSHRIGLGLYDRAPGGLVARRRLELDVQGASTQVDEIAGQPVADLLLINDGDYAYAKIRLDERSTATVASSLSELDDPLARALCWGAAWDMTRDAELSTRRWVELVAMHAPSEQDVGVLQLLLRQTEAAIDRYGDPAQRDGARTLLADRAWRAMEQAAPDSDFQLVWARTFAAAAATPDQLRCVRQLLDGGLQVEGLTVDTDVRWHLVSVLAAAGAADDALIDAERRHDPTDLGTRRAATARAARPEPDAKRDAWDALLTDKSLPLAMMRALVGGFAQPRQEELLAPYGERYVEALPEIWSSRGPEEALLLTGGLFPSTVVSEETVRLADRALDLGTVPPPGRRIIAESRDATQRAMRARAADAAG